MGIPVLVMGESGSGKSTSLRNFDSNEVLVMNVANKPLPFKKKLDVVENATYESIWKYLQENKYKRYVIDDSQYLLAFEMFDRAKETGYNKFTDMALRFRNMIDYIIKKSPNDVIVYLLHHSETTDTGKVKAKTVGKMLDNQLTVEGLFSIVMVCQSDGQSHKFITQSDGYTTAKSPMDMFDLEIDNDLKFVDKTIREYWELSSSPKTNKNERITEE